MIGDLSEEDLTNSVFLEGETLSCNDFSITGDLFICPLGDDLQDELLGEGDEDRFLCSLEEDLDGEFMGDDREEAFLCVLGDDLTGELEGDREWSVLGGLTCLEAFPVMLFSSGSSYNFNFFLGVINMSSSILSGILLTRSSLE